MYFMKKSARVVIRPVPVINKNPVKTVKIDTTKPVKYLINDLTTPELVKEMPAPTVSNNPPYNIQGYVGGGFESITTQGQAANIAVTINNNLNHINANTEKPINRWSTNRNITVIPVAGKMLNASYDRRTLSFFYDKDKTGKDIYACNSTDIVSHELGHAILDTYRPDLWNIASIEIWAFHEAFGDINAFLNLLTHDEAINFIINQTDGDLNKTNIGSQIADELGNAIFNIEGIESGRDSRWLRNINNQFIYTNPSTLNKKGPDNVICAEPHNFSRIMSGALYEIFNMMYYDNLLNNVERVQAIKNARDTLTKYIIKAIQNVVIQPNFFESFAKTLLWVDWSTEFRSYHDRMWYIFTNRNILQPMSALSFDKFEPKIKKTKKVKLIKFTEIIALENNPLYFVDIEVPDKDEESIEAAKTAVSYLNDECLVGEGEIFQVLDGKLKRTRFECCGGGGSLNKPTKYQPEFYKPYKPENNTGCGCGHKKKIVLAPKPTIKKGCYVRYQIPK